jgi:HSF-type DNA-binding
MNDNHNEDDNTKPRDTILLNFSLSSDCLLLEQNIISLDFILRHKIVQERHSFLRKKLFMALRNPIVLTLDPNYCLWFERGFMLQTQAIQNLAYFDSLQKIQDQEALLVSQVQNDTALDKDKDRKGNSCPDPNTTNRNQRDPTQSFPCRLHEILSNPDYSECITWLPHGRSWKILRRKQFERLVIPRHFRHGRYSSFMRQVGVFVDQCFIHPCYSYITGNT